MLEITVSESEKMLLKEAGFKDVISFCLLLSYGDIKNLQNDGVRTVGDVTISIKEQLKKLDKQYEKVRIWYSASDNEDVCTLYFLVSYFYLRNVEISLCEVSDKEHFSLGSYSVCEVNSLVERTSTLSIEEQKTYHENWQKLIIENSELRVLQDSFLISVSFNYLDLEMLNILKQYQGIRFWTFIGECMSKRLCGFYGDIFFTARAAELIQQGVIEIYDTKKEKNILGEWKEQKYIRVKGDLK